MTTPQDEMRAIIHAAVAAMPATNPGVADDLLNGFTMHTEAEDIVAIWQAATAAQAEALAAVTRERDALRKAVSPLLREVVGVCRANCFRVVVATVQRRMCISWDSALALCIEADRQGLFSEFDTSALYPLRSLTPTAPGAQEQA